MQCIQHKLVVNRTLRSFKIFVLIRGLLIYNKTEEDNKLLREVLLHIPFQIVN